MKPNPNSDCICTALFTNVGCAKHGRPYLLSFHRTHPNPVVRLEILAAAFRHEDYYGVWPNQLYIRSEQWMELVGPERNAEDVNFDYVLMTGSFLGMNIEFIPKGDLRVGFRRYA